MENGPGEKARCLWLPKGQMHKPIERFNHQPAFILIEPLKWT